jgi:hypothetical protein
MDEYGQNGGIVIGASFMVPSGDEEKAKIIGHKNQVLREEIYIYGHTFYK